jgi:hypothetical protein
LFDKSIWTNVPLIDLTIEHRIIIELSPNPYETSSILPSFIDSTDFKNLSYC